MTIRLILKEDLTKIPKPNTKSVAYQQAMKLGLEYYGFGRYGRGNRMTHFDDNGTLRKYKGSRYSKKYEQEASDIVDTLQTNPDDLDYYQRELIGKMSKRDVNYYTALGKHWETQQPAINKGTEELNSFTSRNRDVGSITAGKLKDNVPQYDWTNLTSDQTKALINYSGSLYRSINKSMAKIDLGFTWSPDRDNPQVQTDDTLVSTKTKIKYAKDTLHAAKYLDKLTKSSKLPVDSLVYSAVSQKIAKTLENTNEISLTTFRSSTLDPKIAFNNFWGNDKEKAIIQIKLNKGDPGFYMNGQNSTNTFHDEEEIILPRNMKFKITDRTKAYANKSDFGDRHYNFGWQYATTIYIAEPVRNEDGSVQYDENPENDSIAKLEDQFDKLLEKSNSKRGWPDYEEENEMKYAKTVYIGLKATKYGYGDNGFGDGEPNPKKYKEQIRQIINTNIWGEQFSQYVADAYKEDPDGEGRFCNVIINDISEDINNLNFDENKFEPIYLERMLRGYINHNKLTDPVIKQPLVRFAENIRTVDILRKTIAGLISDLNKSNDMNVTKDIFMALDIFSDHANEEFMSMHMKKGSDKEYMDKWLKEKIKETKNEQEDN